MRQELLLIGQWAVENWKLVAVLGGLGYLGILGGALALARMSAIASEYKVH